MRRFLQYLIAVVLLATAVGKLLDVPGFVAVLGSYRAFPKPLLFPIAAVVIAVEMGLAGWLLSGRSLPRAALGSAALHAIYAAWSTATLARGLRLPNCGCFGVFLARPLTWETVVEDLVMVALSLALAALARRAADVASPKSHVPSQT